VNVPRREIGATTLERLAALAQARGLALLATTHSDALLQQLPARAAAALAGFAGLIAALADAAARLPAAELVAEVLSRTRYVEHLAAETRDAALRQRRLDNLAELSGWFRAMQKGGARAGDLAAQLALLAHADRDDPGNAVRLMTLHAAKGLEFRFVFLAGLEDGTLPHEGALDEGRLEEERRLFYVGITRAKALLTLSFSLRARRYGETVSHRPSRFLAELPQDDLHWDGRDPAADAAARREAAGSHLAALRQLLAD
ncbi:MAG: ATP-binding domain-containing protein, partial [Xanthomonadaceae bacterium]|nr:ATP-binding domain-containing protein [Xanthomonadaceae bacterium]